jgi:hypothetical protein
MAAATVRSYRKVLDGVWRPHLGDMVFSHIRHSRLIAIADGHSWSKKTYNNAISVLKRAFGNDDDRGRRGRFPARIRAVLPLVGDYACHFRARCSTTSPFT